MSKGILDRGRTGYWCHIRVHTTNLLYYATVHDFFPPSTTTPVALAGGSDSWGHWRNQALKPSGLHRNNPDDRIEVSWSR